MTDPTPRPRTAARNTTKARTNAVSRKVDDLASTVDRYAADVQEVKDRLDQHGSQIAKRHARLERLVRTLGERAAEDHDAVFGLTQRMTRVEELVGDGMKLNLAAAIAGFTDEQIREILAIQADEELTDSMVIAGIIDRLGVLQTQLDTVIDNLAETRGMVNGQAERLNALDGGEVAPVSLPQVAVRLRTLEEAFREVRQSSLITTVQGSSVPLLIGAIVAVISWPIVVANSHHSGLWEFGLIVVIGGFAWGLAEVVSRNYTVVRQRAASQSSATATTKEVTIQGTPATPPSPPVQVTEVAPQPGQTPQPAPVPTGA